MRNRNIWLICQMKYYLPSKVNSTRHHLFTFSWLIGSTLSGSDVLVGIPIYIRWWRELSKEIPGHQRFFSQCWIFVSWFSFNRLRFIIQPRSSLWADVETEGEQVGHLHKWSLDTPTLPPWRADSAFLFFHPTKVRQTGKFCIIWIQMLIFFGTTGMDP